MVTCLRNTCTQGKCKPEVRHAGLRPCADPGAQLTFVMEGNQAMYRIRIHAWAACAAVLVTLAACAPIKPAQPPAEPATARPSCVAAVAGDPLVGNWLSVSSQKGVAGALRTLYTLNPDGTMS